MKPAAALTLAAGLLAAAGTGAQAPAAPAWEMVATGATARLRGLSAVSDQVIWASGTEGTIIRTGDGGRSWEKRPVPGGAALDFRDIDAVSDRVAYALSIGSGDASRIFKTSDAGATWTLQFRNEDPKAFFDAMVFTDPLRGFAVSDAVDGRLVLLHSVDGERWVRVPPERLPAALAGEGAYAASGTNLDARGSHVWLGTTASRVIRSTDGGQTWSAAIAPLLTGPSAGIFSIAFRDERHGLVVGGDYKNEEGTAGTAALSEDGGASWRQVTGMGGFRSAVTFVPGRQDTAVAVGPSGTDYSTDGGRTWRAVESRGFHTISAARRGTTVWAAGENGAVGVLRF